MGVEGVGIMNPCEIVHEKPIGQRPDWESLMQNKLHEAQSLPRRYAGYYETLNPPCQHWGSVHHTVFYSTVEDLECQEEMNKDPGNYSAKYAKSTKTCQPQQCCAFR